MLKFFAEIKIEIVCTREKKKGKKLFVFGSTKKKNISGHWIQWRSA